MEIFSAHRLPTKNNTTAHLILVILNSIRKKDELISKSKEMKLEGIYVNPHLTLNTHLLLEKAREIRDQGFIQFAWFSNGLVRIRKDTNSKAIIVKSIEALEEIYNRREHVKDRESQDKEVSSESVTNGRERGRRIHRHWKTPEADSMVEKEVKGNCTRPGQSRIILWPHGRKQLNRLN